MNGLQTICAKCQLPSAGTREEPLMWSGGKPYCYKCATVIWLFDEDGLAMQANDHVELARNVEIGGKLETVRVRFPTELLRFGSPQANAIIEASFAKAIRNFQPATKAWIAPY